MIEYDGVPTVKAAENTQEKTKVTVSAVTAGEDEEKPAPLNRHQRRALTKIHKKIQTKARLRRK